MLVHLCLGVCLCVCVCGDAAGGGGGGVRDSMYSYDCKVWSVVVNLFHAPKIQRVGI